MYTGQLVIASSFRIQVLSLPGHHLKLARHVSYVCGAVVDGIQLRITLCEEDNVEALQFLHREFIATAAVGHFSEKPLVENRRHAGEGDARHFCACSV